VRKVYRGRDVEVSFDLDMCVHIAECLRGHPQVFDLNRRPWILPDIADADEVARILVLFAVGLFPFSLFQLLLRGFYAMQDTRTPALINLAATVINTAVNLVYFRYFGVKGLALGQTTAYTFATIAAALVIRSRLNGLDGRRLARSFVEIAAAALATGLAAFAVAQIVGRALGTASFGSQAAQVAAGTAAGVLAFAAAATLLRIGEVSIVKDLVRRRAR